MKQARKASRPRRRRAKRDPASIAKKGISVGFVVAALALPIVLAMSGPASSASLGGHCVLALDPAMDGALVVPGTADVTAECGLASNSSSDLAAFVAGSLNLYGQLLQAHGHIVTSSAGRIAYDVPPRPLSGRIADPYAGVLTELMADPSCIGTSPIYVNSVATLNPGRYCGGIRINGNADFLPGTYILDNGGLKIVGGGDISGLGVTFILTAMDAANLGAVDLSGGGTLLLRAPNDTAAYPGLLFIQDPHVPNLDIASPLPSHKLTGGSNMNLEGTLYFPDTEILYAGVSSTALGCTQIVAKAVTLLGRSYLQTDATACAEAGVDTGIQ